MEKYMSFTVGTKSEYYDKEAEKIKTKVLHELTFIDSLQFMSSSLSKLVDNLKTGGLEKFEYTNQEFNKYTELMTRKGVYPYSFMDDWKKFKVNVTELCIEDFKNDLTGDEISIEDFDFYKSICKRFNIKTLDDYHDLYLKSDVLLLADVFENFRTMCKEYYGLDCAHYISAPGLSWDALLKMTDISLELISDVDQHLFIEKGLRGGISVIAHRKGEANNKYLKNYDENKETKYINLLDANNLYGWGMIQSLPYGGFKWLENPDQFDIKTVKENSEIGHILEVDIEYPKELHDLHNDYPYCAEQVVVKDDMLSDYCKMISDKHQLKLGNIQKLIPNLNNKEKYVIHERNLKQAVDAGLKVTKIHRVLQFKQKPWMKEYIDFNTAKRTLAKNDFEKDFFKLMNNSVYGKTLQNVRKQQNIKLISDDKLLNKYLSHPGLINRKIFDEDLVAVHMIKEKLKLNKPIYVGFAVLELSKWLMYDFHYGFIKPKYGSDAQLLFTDTDSLCYEIKTKDFYQDMYDNKEWFDLSDMTKQFQDNTNKKVLGKMKDETAGIPIKEFIGLRSKMYSVLIDDGKEKKTAKGIGRSVIKKELKHETYKNILETSSKMYSKMKVIRSCKHRLYTMDINKVSLSAYDDKRYILNDGITSVAYGHFRIGVHSQPVKMSA